jgi:hypothetical protein
MILNYPKKLKTNWGGVGGNLVDQIDVQNALDAKQAISEKGSADGYAELDATGKVPASQLPAYVDDVIEVADFASLPATGESGKIYITLDDNKTFRWGGSVYVEISASLALGETSSTAYRGDRGKIGYDHSFITTGNPHNVNKGDVGLGNADNTTDASKPISTATQTALDGKTSPTGSETVSGSWLFQATSGDSYVEIQKATASDQSAFKLNSEAGYTRFIMGLAGGSDDDWFLGLYDETGVWVGAPIYVSSTTGGVTMAGDLTANNLSGINTGDQDLSSYMQGANNLSEISSSAVALTNLSILNSVNGSITIGTSAGENIVDAGFYNIAIGGFALNDVTDGLYNIGIGLSSLSKVTTGDYLTAVGAFALELNTSGTFNVASGFQALKNNTTGSYNTAFGVQALLSNIDGNQNIGMGAWALFLNSTGTGNTAIGYGSLFTQTGATDGNTAIGSLSMFGNINGQKCTAVGYSALAQSNGDNNIGIGRGVASDLTTADDCIIIGTDLQPQSNTDDGQLSIGNLIFGTGMGVTGTSISTGIIGIGKVPVTHRLEVDGTVLADTVLVDDEAYGDDWDESLEVPTKNAIFDRLETVIDRPFAHLTIATSVDVGGPDNTTTYMDWDGTELNKDTGFTHSTATNSSRIQVDVTGRYQLNWTMTADNTGSARFTLMSQYRVNGATVVTRGRQYNYSRGSGYNAEFGVGMQTEVELTAGDYIELSVEVADTDSVGYVVNTIPTECEVIIRKIN